MVDRQKIFDELLEEFHKLKTDPETGEVYTKQVGKDGREYNDETPMEPPLGYKRAPTMVEIIREQVRSHHLAILAAQNDMETFEEAEDFDIGDDYDPHTPYENDFDPTISEMAAAVENDKLQREAAAKKQPAPVADGPASETGAAPAATPPKPPTVQSP